MYYQLLWGSASFEENMESARTRLLTTPPITLSQQHSCRDTDALHPSNDWPSKQEIAPAEGVLVTRKAFASVSRK